MATCPVSLTHDCSSTASAPAVWVHTVELSTQQGGPCFCSESAGNEHASTGWPRPDDSAYKRNHAS